ncbi:hypothetical protein CQW23_17578 [Capsicum baccatum]|uniref:RING-CH-type domain-containing protein n=2 Tax=Capsicum TaxID=4071 RepID=A0A1U8HBY9_CAPAN|nr:E3 ubiquitin-protein ligase MARCHF4 [Capsicum annuum]PHT43553.1 hypothetical protein CQW23_17578 [Capsicum baccatum]PHU12503.1 hypothetical protein BC332_19433 [Capsicum chinense]KAF3620994.1 putative zinc finger A20 and AN1 domain-containing stress-associated protein 10-like [Capsicum annuum]KAF3664135.1 putative zinc finger A20 and AN1 domain-containing stress-associated protein 10-like [Capsicum annuum]PHT76744.1 hypothetical protein T459_20266 [Capsicum annuum]
MQDLEATSGNSKTKELSNSSNNPEIKEADQITHEEVKETDDKGTKCREKIERSDEEVVVDIDENQGTEKVCRICHLNDESMEILQLGCDCKGELGVCHRHCAEAWFNQRGNRSCEICGKTAKNVETRVLEERPSRMMVIEWNQRAVEARRSSSYITNSSSTHNDCRWRCQQSCCNFLLACFVIAFTLPWFFRLNLP